MKKLIAALALAITAISCATINNRTPAQEGQSVNDPLTGLWKGDCATGRYGDRLNLNDDLTSKIKELTSKPGSGNLWTRTDLSVDGNTILVHQEYYSGYSPCEKFVIAFDITSAYDPTPYHDWTIVGLKSDKFKFNQYFFFQKNKDGLLKSPFTEAAPMVDLLLPAFQMYRQADYDALMQKRKDEAARPPNSEIVQQAPGLYLNQYNRKQIVKVTLSAKYNARTPLGTPTIKQNLQVQVVVDSDGRSISDGPIEEFICTDPGEFRCDDDFTNLYQNSSDGVNSDDKESFRINRYRRSYTIYKLIK